VRRPNAHSLTVFAREHPGRRIFRMK